MKKTTYLTYLNPITNQKGIFTRETLQKMSNERFEFCEKAIMEQLKQIGIPKESALGTYTIPNTNKPKIYYDKLLPESDIIGYEWITLPGSCDECKKLAKTIFKNIKQIPDKPHPNCRCKIYALYS